MPCYEERNRPYHVETVYKENPINNNLSKSLEKVTQLGNQLTAILCAIDNELVNRGIAESVYATAQRNGLIDIMSFIQSHRNDDRIRLQKDIVSRYSKHELSLIKRLIKETK